MLDLTKIKIREELLNSYNNKDDGILLLTKTKLIKHKVVEHLKDVQQQYPIFYKKVFNLTTHKSLPDGLGKGEILIYFLYDDIDLSGVKYQTDIIKNGKPCFEVKSVRRSKDLLYNFRLGVNSKEYSRQFIENLKDLCSNYQHFLGNSPDIINWEEIPIRVFDYIESFGDLNEILKSNKNFKLKFSLDENLSIIDADGNNLGIFTDNKTLKNILDLFAKSKLENKSLKIKYSNLKKIKNKFISDLVRSNKKTPILFFEAHTGNPIDLVMLNTKNINVIRVTQGQVRIAYKL